MDEPEPALRVNGLVRRFGDVVAVDGLTFDVQRGETFGLLGHNGAGKTTTIRLANGVIARDAGEISVLGLDPAVDGVRLRARTGVLTEAPSLDERLTARENLQFYGRLYGLDAPRLAERVEAMIDAFGVTGRADERVGGYSRGMKQRVALARTLVHEPDLLFLDEPTAALDPVATREVHTLIDSFAGDQRRTVVLTTHNLVEAQRLCDRVVILRNGRALAVGSPSDLGRAAGIAPVLRIEIGPGEQERAASVLREAGLPGARVDGEVLTAPFDERSRIPAAVAAMVRAGLSVYGVHEAEADLEAVYFALHQAGDNEPEPS